MTIFGRMWRSYSRSREVYQTASDKGAIREVSVDYFVHLIDAITKLKASDVGCS